MLMRTHPLLAERGFLVASDYHNEDMPLLPVPVIPTRNDWIIQQATQKFLDQLGSVVKDETLFAHLEAELKAQGLDLCIRNHPGRGVSIEVRDKPEANPLIEIFGRELAAILFSSRGKRD